MKRDMDLIRKLLLALETKLPSETNLIHEVSDISIEGYSHSQINYHAHLLVDAGFLIVSEQSNFDNLMLTRLTWEGCEFLDSVKDNKRWDKAKKILEGLGTFAAPIVKEVMIGLAKEQLKQIGFPVQ